MHVDTKVKTLFQGMYVATTVLPYYNQAVILGLKTQYKGKCVSHGYIQDKKAERQSRKARCEGNDMCTIARYYK